MKIGIIGGGVAGLAIGWRLAASGCAVDIFERGLAGRATSWAAAGMLAATAETGKDDDDHARLAHAGLRAWPDFAAELETIYGESIGYRRCGALLVATSESHAAHLKETAAALAARGEKAFFLKPEEARTREPLLASDIKSALYAPDDAQIDNRALGRALTSAFVQAGGILREHCGVDGLDLRGGSVRGVLANGVIFPADKVIVAAGAWSSLVAGEGVLPPVRPAKGQMTALAPEGDARMPNALIWGEETIYLVPRGETLLVGATVEDSGFETSVSRETRDLLVARAVRLIPSLASWRIAESWAGLRPRTPDDAPVLGATPVSGLYVASGQYRNGILFAPVMADLMRRLMLDQDPGPLLGTFDTARFAKA